MNCSWFKWAIRKKQFMQSRRAAVVLCVMHVHTYGGRGYLQSHLTKMEWGSEIRDYQPCPCTTQTNKSASETSFLGNVILYFVLFFLSTKNMHYFKRVDREMGFNLLCWYPFYTWEWVLPSKPLIHLINVWHLERSSFCLLKIFMPLSLLTGHTHTHTHTHTVTINSKFEYTCWEW